MNEKAIPALTVDPDIFFDLLNDVLISFGRDKLDPKSAHKKVIQVQPSDRVLQILAGPGSGKTEVLVWRVLFELFVNNTPAARLMVTTFTKRAATELQIRLVERADEFLRIGQTRGLHINDPQVHNLRVGTIHSLCDALLAEFDTAYVEAGTQVIDEAETAARIAKIYHYTLGYASPPKTKRVLNRLEDQEALVALFRPPWEDKWPTRMMERVDFIKAILAQHTETWLPRCFSTNTLNGIEQVHSTNGLTADLCKLQLRWEQYLDKEGVLDFATIQKRFLERQSTLVSGFDHVLVDEFQDSNPIQFALHTQWLQSSETKLTVVGDDDQAIYRFRGSDIECFHGLEPHCSVKEISYRRETLAVNYRSTRNIVKFTEKFKQETILAQLSMPKQIMAGPKATQGVPVRLLIGDWADLCKVVADEIDGVGAGRPQKGDALVPTVALLAFSTSEREYRERKSPALALRKAVEAKGIRVYNPRNKTAGNNESPVSMLLGLISYLVDPVSHAPVGKKGGMIEVWASMQDASKAQYARAQRAAFWINDRHAALQKAFIKADGGKIGAPAPSRADMLTFVDDIRAMLTQLKPDERGRLTLAGFVARLLAFPLFRQSGFTVALFRQALFTQLLEANIAPTRLSMDSLDQPLEVTNLQGKIQWPNRYWNLLSVFGGYLDNTNLDDPEVDAFEEDAILMITFHQAKGLEFDHVYVAATGRTPDIGPALRTHLFSGRAVPYDVTAGLKTTDPQVLALALGDREREVYVALTRGKQSVTILHDPALMSQGPYAMNPAIEQLFATSKPELYPLNPAVQVREFTHA
jgi:superfamily I DNA/RNA helicase